MLASRRMQPQQVVAHCSSPHHCCQVSVGGAGRSQEFPDVIGNKKTRKRHWDFQGMLRNPSWIVYLNVSLN